MKNILKEKPQAYENLAGRLRFSCDFVDISQIRNRRVLNIGCGFGWFERYCLDQGVQEIVAIEVDEESLVAARENIDDPRARFLVASALDLPFPEAYFDTVVSWEVLEHIPKRTEVRMFREIRRVLKPKGFLYLSTPYRSLISTVFDPAWWLIGHRHYSRESLLTFARESGLQPLSIQTKGGKWEVLGWWNLYIAKWIFRRTWFLDNLFKRKLNREFREGERGFTNIFAQFNRLS